MTVNRDEELVADWLRTQGHAVRHLTNGDDPPDLVVDENVAVEVTTIASFAFTSVWDFMEGVCRSLGPAEGGRGYFISVNADEGLLQGRGRKEKPQSNANFDLTRGSRCATTIETQTPPYAWTSR